MGPATNKVVEEHGIVKPLREEGKAYIVRQKRYCMERGKRQKLDT